MSPIITLPARRSVEAADHRRAQSAFTASGTRARCPQKQASSAPTPRRILPSCFLRLMDQPTFAFDRLSRYEHTLWRQARQIVFTLEILAASCASAEPI